MWCDLRAPAFVQDLTRHTSVHMCIALYCTSRRHWDYSYKRTMLATATVFQNPRLPVGNLMFLALLDLPVHPYDNMVSDFAPRIVIVGGVLVACLLLRGYFMVIPFIPAKSLLRCELQARRLCEKAKITVSEICIWYRSYLIQPGLRAWRLCVLRQLRHTLRSWRCD